MKELIVATTTHGRVLVREAQDPSAILVGFHGYMENAAIQMERLAAMAGAEPWTLVSIQALNRFYKGRTEEVVASWMTREDRDAAIADNIEYVNRVVEAVLSGLTHEAAVPIVCIGFSQGVAMAFRAGVRGARKTAGVIAVGGDVPPELLADPAAIFPSVLLARGARDEWFTSAKLDADGAQLQSREVAVETLTYDGAHEWTADVSAAAAAFVKGIVSRAG